MKIKNITRLWVAANLLFSLSSCSIINYNNTTKHDLIPVEFDYFACQTLDSLMVVDNAKADSVTLAEIGNYLHAGSLFDSNYEEMIFFTAEQSSKVLLAEYSKVLSEDIVLKYEDLKHNFHFPLDVGHITSNYGWRRNRMHAGVDLRAHRGDNIYAVFDGVVRMSKYYTAFGNVVVIRHNNGLETLYAHASKLKVKVNDKVKAGDVIALAGRTGRATGDHLHFEIRVVGQCINPSVLLDAKNASLQQKNIYITMYKGRIFASNNDSPEQRKAEIIEAISIKYHTVKRGDTLSRIAVNNNTTVSAICRLNKIKSTSILRLGQRIRVR